jgi:hypothetical protein
MVTMVMTVVVMAMTVASARPNRTGREGSEQYERKAH